MFFFVVLVISGLIVLVVAHPDENLTIAQLITKYNYPVEIHTIETIDGYILKLQRIPHGLSNNAPKEVAILVHGMGGSAENYVVLGPTGALAFYLADRGYDVWLFNARGTAHSRKHRSLNPNRDRKKFWDFSWHEIGTIDLPTSINYILRKTGKDQLFYVGHSQGTTVLFVMLSELPEMNEKIKVAVLLAAAVKVNYTPSAWLTLITRFIPLLQRVLTMLNWHEFIIPNSPMINRILKSLCSDKFIADVCVDVISIIGGSNSGYFNKTLLPTVLETAPSGLAVRQAWHYGQIVLTGEFKQYDFGKRKNLKLYNSTKPPLYDLSNTKIPLGIFYAVDDHFGNEKMTKELVKELPNVALLYEVKPKGFNHIDYVLASNVIEAVYDPLYKLFQEYEDNIS